MLATLEFGLRQPTKRASEEGEGRENRHSNMASRSIASFRRIVGTHSARVGLMPNRVFSSTIIAATSGRPFFKQASITSAVAPGVIFLANRRYLMFRDGARSIRFKRRVVVEFSKDDCFLFR
jgi:hypothetical protein